MSNVQQNMAVVSVTSKSYWPGTYVMIKSFRKLNPWFQGEFVLITRDKTFIESQLDRKKLTAKVVEPSQQLLDPIKALLIKIPDLKKYESRLYIFEIFRLQQYSHILYFDSDILHVRKLNKKVLFASELAAVSDPSFFRGFLRSRTTLERVPISENRENCYENFFNSGVLSIQNRYINKSIYNRLIAAIKVENYINMKDLLLDEPVLNKVFEGLVRFLEPDYNYSVHLLARGTNRKTVRCLHFTGKNKPWKLAGNLRLMLRRGNYITYILKWHKHLYFK